jgi:hypothetical protein
MKVISDFITFDHVVVEVLGFGTILICRLMPTFRRNMLSPSSGAVVTRQGSGACFSEMLASTCKSTWRQNPRLLQQPDDNRCENIKSHLYQFCQKHLMGQEIWYMIYSDLCFIYERVVNHVTLGIVVLCPTSLI